VPHSRILFEELRYALFVLTLLHPVEEREAIPMDIEHRRLLLKQLQQMLPRMSTEIRILHPDSKHMFYSQLDFIKSEVHDLT